MVAQTFWVGLGSRSRLQWVLERCRKIIKVGSRSIDTYYKLNSTDLIPRKKSEKQSLVRFRNEKSFDHLNSPRYIIIALITLSSSLK